MFRKTWTTCKCKNPLFIPIAIITSVQKVITYSDVKIYNGLPSNNVNLKNDRKQSKNKLHRYHLNNLFYSVKEFLEFSTVN